MVECLSIGAHAVRRAQIQKGETVLVIGAGPIGMGVMQFAKQSGANVIALDLVPERLKFCRDHYGVDHLVDARREPMVEIERLTEGDYPTVVFDATGNATSMMNALSFVAHGGRLVLVSLVNQNISFYDPDFHRRETTLIGSRNATRRDMEDVIQSIENGRVDASSFITHRARFDQLIGTFESWLRPETGVIKAVVEV